MSNSAMTITYTANKSIRTHEGEKKSICGFVSASTLLFGYKIKLKRVPYRWLSCDMKRYSRNMKFTKLTQKINFPICKSGNK